jgi:hypothetical protein
MEWDMCALSELLDFLELTRELVGEGVLEGLDDSILVSQLLKHESMTEYAAE